MDIFYDNLSWMGLNIFLALLGVFFGWAFLYSKKGYMQIILFILWVLFIPNTIYLITDLEHIYKQFGRVDLLFKVLLIIQYLVVVSLGIISFIWGMYPVDKVFAEIHLKKKDHLRIVILLVVNLLIGFALILGKFERTHSIYVFTNFKRVLEDSRAVFQTPALLYLVIFFGIVTNLVYFAFKKVLPVKVKTNRRR